MFYIDPLYIIISLPAFILSIGATILLRLTYGRYSSLGNAQGLNGLDAVTKISQGEGYNIQVEVIQGDLSDNYNPGNKTVSLSPNVANAASIASVGIAAHELGHVDQHHKGFFLITLRTAIVPVVNIGSTLGYFLIIIGLIFNFLNLSYLGLVLFSATSIFTLLTLPVEIDASRRAITLISKYNLVGPGQLNGVKAVLFAAALTYVAATFQSFAQLLYFFLRVQGSRNND